MTAVRFGLQFPGREAAFASVHQPGCSSMHPDSSRSLHFERARDVLIEGDNLEVVRMLQRAYAGRVQLVYIDPPYNTGHDFVYRDRFAQSAEAFLRSTEQVDVHGNPLVCGKRSEQTVHGRTHVGQAIRVVQVIERRAKEAGGRFRVRQTAHAEQTRHDGADADGRRERLRLAVVTSLVVPDQVNHRACRERNRRTAYAGAGPLPFATAS